MPVKPAKNRRRRQKASVKTLHAGHAHVRTTQARQSRHKRSKPKRSRSKAISAFTTEISAFPTEMNALVGASLQFPMRVMACRTPLQLWLEQARLMHAWLIASQSMTFARPFVPPLPVA